MREGINHPNSTYCWPVDERTDLVNQPGLTKETSLSDQREDAHINIVSPYNPQSIDLVIRVRHILD